MKSTHPFFFLLIVSVLLSACGTETPLVSSPTSTLKPVPTQTATITPSPTLIPTETPTLVPPTPTYGPPLAVQNFYVKKAKCIVFKPTVDQPTYRVELWFKLSWQDVSDNEDGFWLYRDGNRIAELPPNTIEYIDVFELVKGGRTSTYYVVAYNSAGETKGDLLSYPNPC